MDVIIEAEVMNAKATLLSPAIAGVLITPMVSPVRPVMASVSMVRRLSRGRASLSAVAPSFHTETGGMTALAYAA